MHTHCPPFFPFGSTVVSKKGHATSNSRSVPHVEPYYRSEANEKQVFFEVEMPGVCKSDITVKINGHVMTIIGTRYRQSHWTTTKDVDTIERYNTSFSEDIEYGINDEGEEEERCVENTCIRDSGTSQSTIIPFLVYSLEMRLGHDTDIDHISCVCFKDGILMINIPAVAKECHRTLPIP